MKKLNKLLGTVVILFLLSTNLLAQTITGNVFRDFNANGIKDNTATFNEVGVGGVTVKCTDAAGITGTTTTSAATATLGNYSLSGCNGATRVEFTWTLAGDYSGAAGTGSNTSVQFINATRSNINFGINYPGHFSQANPDMVTSNFINGRPSNGEGDVIVKFPSTASGQTSLQTSLAQAEQVGSTWGLAYNRDSKLFYAAAFVKRHVALKDNNTDGTEDIGAIYSVTSTGSPALWLNLTTLGVNVGSTLMPDITTRNLDVNPYNPAHDSAIFDLVGRVGLGDIDISDDNKQLFVMNLYDRSVYTIDIATKTLVGSGIAVPNDCSNGNVRPFALEYHRGKIYAGAICDAATSNSASDLEANLYRLDGSTFTNILTFPLTYTKGFVESPNFGKLWQPWRSNFYPAATTVGTGSFQNYIYPQPIFADIEFDHNEDLILVFNDRTGDQVGFRNYGTDPLDTALYVAESGGDILRASLVSGSYSLESNGTSGGVTTAGAGNGEGIGGGEFYYQDYYLDPDYHNLIHSETVTGGSALLFGSGQVTVNVYNPFVAFSGGPVWMNNVSGSVERGYQVFNGGSQINFGKANGLGDLELLSDPAPLEIGNRVWLDTDKDGIQDPNEAGIDGVTVTLMIGNDMVTTTTATVNGQAGVYYFKDGMAGLPAAWNNIIPRNALAKLYVADTYTSGATTYKATIANTGTNDAIDADGINMASQGTTAASVRIDFNTGFAGQNNHTYDFGYNVDTLMNFLNCAEVSAQDQTDLDSTPSDGTGDEYACATTTKTTVTYDWGDNPDTGAGSGAGNYLTSNTDNGPRHQIVTGLKLGATVDAETDGQGTGTTSTGDDTTGTPDDEDGVTLPTFTEGVATPLNFTLMNMTGTAAKLCGWIDFDKNGVYDNATERQCTNVADAATTATLTFTAPAGTSGTTYARFRLSTDAAFITAMDPTGVATSGEVEDYQATITSAPIFDLALDKKLSTGQAATVNAGDLVSFEITVYNQGSVAASGISITDYIDLTKFNAFSQTDNPAGNSTVTVLPYSWSAAGVASLTGTLPVGASLKIPVKLRIKAGATGTAVNKAEISAATGGTDIDSTPDGTDGNQTGEVLPVMVDDQVTGNGTTGGDEDDHDLAQVTVNTPLTADLELVKIADKTQVRVGDLLTYTLQITNKGPGTATAVKIKDTLPLGVSLQGTPVASVGSFDSASGVWTVGDMLNGATATLTIVVKVQ